MPSSTVKLATMGPWTPAPANADTAPVSRVGTIASQRLFVSAPARLQTGPFPTTVTPPAALFAGPTVPPIPPVPAVPPPPRGTTMGSMSVLREMPNYEALRDLKADPARPVGLPPTQAVMAARQSADAPWRTALASLLTARLRLEVAIAILGQREMAVASAVQAAQAEESAVVVPPKPAASRRSRKNSVYSAVNAFAHARDAKAGGPRRVPRPGGLSTSSHSSVTSDPEFDDSEDATEMSDGSNSSTPTNGTSCRSFDNAASSSIAAGASTIGADSIRPATDEGRDTGIPPRRVPVPLIDSIMPSALRSTSATPILGGGADKTGGFSTDRERRDTVRTVDESGGGGAGATGGPGQVCSGDEGRSKDGHGDNLSVPPPLGHLRSYLGVPTGAALSPFAAAKSRPRPRGVSIHIPEPRGGYGGDSGAVPAALIASPSAARLSAAPALGMRAAVSSFAILSSVPPPLPTAVSRHHPQPTGGDGGGPKRSVSIPELSVPASTTGPAAHLSHVTTSPIPPPPDAPPARAGASLPPVAAAANAAALKARHEPPKGPWRLSPALSTALIALANVNELIAHVHAALETVAKEAPPEGYAALYPVLGSSKPVYVCGGSPSMRSVWRGDSDAEGGAQPWLLCWSGCVGLTRAAVLRSLRAQHVWALDMLADSATRRTLALAFSPRVTRPENVAPTAPAEADTGADTVGGVPLSGPGSGKSDVLLRLKIGDKNAPTDDAEDLAILQENRFIARQVRRAHMQHNRMQRQIRWWYGDVAGAGVVFGSEIEKIESPTSGDATESPKGRPVRGKLDAEGGSAIDSVDDLSRLPDRGQVGMVRGTDGQPMSLVQLRRRIDFLRDWLGSREDEPRSVLTRVRVVLAEAEGSGVSKEEIAAISRGLDRLVHGKRKAVADVDRHRSELQHLQQQQQEVLLMQQRMRPGAVPSSALAESTAASGGARAGGAGSGDRPAVPRGRPRVTLSPSVIMAPDDEDASASPLRAAQLLASFAHASRAVAEGSPSGRGGVLKARSMIGPGMREAAAAAAKGGDGMMSIVVSAPTDTSSAVGLESRILQAADHAYVASEASDDAADLTVTRAPATVGQQLKQQQRQQQQRHLASMGVGVGGFPTHHSPLSMVPAPGHTLLSVPDEDVISLPPSALAGHAGTSTSVRYGRLPDPSAEAAQRSKLEKGWSKSVSFVPPAATLSLPRTRSTERRGSFSSGAAGGGGGPHSRSTSGAALSSADSESLSLAQQSAAIAELLAAQRRYVDSKASRGGGVRFGGGSDASISRVSPACSTDGCSDDYHSDGSPIGGRVRRRGPPSAATLERVRERERELDVQLVEDRARLLAERAARRLARYTPAGSVPPTPSPPRDSKLYAEDVEPSHRPRRMRQHDSPPRSRWAAPSSVWPAGASGGFDVHAADPPTFSVGHSRVRRGRRTFGSRDASPAGGSYDDAADADEWAALGIVGDFDETNVTDRGTRLRHTRATRAASVAHAVLTATDTEGLRRKRPHRPPGDVYTTTDGHPDTVVQIAEVPQVVW